MLKTGSKAWSLGLDEVMKQINDSTHESLSTGVTPNHVMFGRKRKAENRDPPNMRGVIITISEDTIDRVCPVRELHFTSFSTFPHLSTHCCVHMHSILLPLLLLPLLLLLLLLYTEMPWKILLKPLKTTIIPAAGTAFTGLASPYHLRSPPTSLTCSNECTLKLFTDLHIANFNYHVKAVSLSQALAILDGWQHLPNDHFSKIKHTEKINAAGLIT